MTSSLSNIPADNLEIQDGISSRFSLLSAVVLVTGATGYVGSHVVKLLLEDGQLRVRAVVRSLDQEDKVKFLKDLVPEAKHPVELVQADLLKEDTWKELSHFFRPSSMDARKQPLFES